MKKYHICESLEGLDNRIKQLQRKKKKIIIPWLTVEGRPATLKELRIAIAEAKQKGYDVLPPCDNIKSDGHCAGHEIEDDGNE